MTKIRILSVFCGILALLGAAGCQTAQEREAALAREERLHARLDELQQQVATLGEQINEVESQPKSATDDLTLRPAPVVPVQSAPPAPPSKKEQLQIWARQSPPPVVGRPKRSGRSSKSSKKGAIRVNVSVRTIQKALANAGVNPGKIDGKLGPKTLTAIKQFQAKVGLKVDGVVGTRTWARLRTFLDLAK